MSETSFGHAQDREPVERLTASLEDYIEAIFHIEARKHAARAKDIARRMHVNNSSVTGALHALAERGMVNYKPYDIITLTDAGREAAEDVVKRHRVLRDFFVRMLAINESDAEEAACKMEHAVPATVIDRIVCFVEHVDALPPDERGWLKSISKDCRKGGLEQARCDARQDDAADVRGGDGKGVRENEERMHITLADLKPGEKGKIVRVGGEGAASRRLRDMGFTRGATLTIVRVAPLGDPVEIEVRGYNISVRKAEAESVDVERVS